jgi:hypothetical protein
MMTPSRSRRRFENRRGALIVLVSVSLIVLMGILVLAIDGGGLQQQRRIAQTAADAGALAGAWEILRNNTGAVQASALNETKRNGFENSVNGVSVTVTYPATGTFSGTKFVEVEVRRTVPTTFASIFGRGSAVVRSHATAGVAMSEYCFLVLDPTSANALKLENSAQLRGSGCGIQVNSTNASGTNVAGNSAQITAPSFGVAAGSAVGAEKIITDGGVQYGVPATPDPLSQLAMPSVPNTCDYGSAAAPAVLMGTITLNPGTYCGGINVNGNFTLRPGLYILRGGGLTIIGGAGSLQASGTGVTFLNTAPPAGATYSWGPIFVQSGSVNLNLWANTDPASALPGVLFYTDPAAPYMVNLFKANSVSRMDGTMYFPTGMVKFESGATFTINGALIAYQVEMSQSVNLTFTGYGGGSEFFALRRATVVE